MIGLKDDVSFGIRNRHARTVPFAKNEFTETERTRPRLPQKWAIEFSVEGDLRFLSHHDMMRAMERLLRRAKLPVRHTQGFNPHPVMSLVLPRPVSVASRAELLAVSLEQDISPQYIVDQINNAAPVGLKAQSAKPYEGKNPQARGAKYELRLSPEQVAPLRLRLDELNALTDWPIQRRTGKTRDGLEPPKQAMNLRPLIQELLISDEHLLIHLVPQNQAWARPSEVLALLSLDERLDLAKLVRVEVDYVIGD